MSETRLENPYHKIFGKCLIVEETETEYLISVNHRVPKGQIMEYEEHLEQIKAMAKKK